MFWFIFIYLSIFLFHFFFLVVAVYSMAHCVLDSTANGSSLVSLGESSGLGGDVDKEHGYLFTPPWLSICFPPYHLFVEQSRTQTLRGFWSAHSFSQGLVKRNKFRLLF